MSQTQNILIISPFFYPELISTGKFNSDLAVALRDKGCKVTIICSHPIYPKWKVEPSHKQIEGINIVRGGAKIRYSKSTTIRRITLEIWFAFFVLKKIFKYQKEADVIVPVFPPSLAFYFILPFLKRSIKKTGMVHDLQEVYSSGKKGLVNKIIKFFINKVEGKALKSCDSLIFLSEEMKQTAKNFYKLSEEKLSVQYPFSSLNMGNLTNDLEDVLKQDKTHIVYSGALGEKQNPLGVYDFYNYASSRLDNTIFHFFSQGLIFENLKSRNNNSKIQFHNLVPRENIEELYNKSSVQIIPQLPNTSKGSLPSKLPNLLASGCKILFITDKNSEIDVLFTKHNLNKVVTNWENELLLESLKELLFKNNNTENQLKIAQELFSLDSMINKVLK